MHQTPKKQEIAKNRRKVTVSKFCQSSERGRELQHSWTVTSVFWADTSTFFDGSKEGKDLQVGCFLVWLIIRLPPNFNCVVSNFYELFKILKFSSKEKPETLISSTTFAGFPCISIRIWHIDEDAMICGITLNSAPKETKFISKSASRWFKVFIFSKKNFCFAFENLFHFTTKKFLIISNLVNSNLRYQF